MLMAMSEDLRAILVKLADRLHNMRILNHLRPDKQERIRRKTMEIYAPSAFTVWDFQQQWELKTTFLPSQSDGVL